MKRTPTRCDRNLAWRRALLAAAVATALTLASGASAAKAQTLPGIDPALSQAFARFDKGERDAARAQIESLAANQSADPGYVMVVGTLWLMRAEWRSAEPHVRAALAKMPDFAPAHNALGVVLLQTSRPEEAEAVLRPAVTRFTSDASYGELVFNFAMACAMVNKRLEASDWFEKSIAFAPNAAINHFSLGENELNLRRLDRAEKEFRLAMELAPPHPDARWKLAVTIAEAGRPAEAEPLFAKAVSTGPDRSRFSAAFRYGVFLFERERAAEALPLLQSVTSGKPDDRMAWSYLARALRALGRKEEAAVAVARYRELQAKADRDENEFLLSLIRDKLQSSEGKVLPDRG